MPKKAALWPSPIALNNTASPINLVSTSPAQCCSFTIHVPPPFDWTNSNVPLLCLAESQTNPFQTVGFPLSFAKGLQFVRQCAAPLRLCFFYNLRAKLEGTKSKVRYFWRIYLI